MLLFRLRQSDQRLSVCFKSTRYKILALKSQLHHLIFTVKQTSVDSGYDLFNLRHA